ncbi:fungal specific transcription factor domain-containing protein [Colletotrichum graminicola]|uniref:Fungal specific transcription factor domain-containing protein n=1 Tax=Colletotrichum graminicola (strain M1.001 / M2 / FGSC 10212) TaxID=645133 RepID=E3QK57_COLGM|nr:fungal specific transcription factor domain-containing protein [Colletotrichum graminicola M1.001]EFQ31245.1 fungal specific transcription factor domain-containing protein [Colletotrichum graminicola M1.001]WDK19243.1 fungal specific transcription factor domain-containing protein [Colletotrichum graminicola]
MLNLKFINTTNVPVTKRKIALHACETCRRRKKRCEHPLGEGESPPPHTVHWRKRGRFTTLGSSTTASDSPNAATPIDPCLQYSPEVLRASSTLPEDGDDSEVSESIHVAGSVPPTRSPRRHVASPSPLSASLSALAEHSTPRSSSPELRIDEESIQNNEDRFVGDLNPEGTFLADSPGTRPGYAQSNSVGVWYSRRNNKNNPTTELASAVSVDYAEHQFLAVLPKKEHYDQLKRIYLRDVHRILPIMNVDILEKPTSTISQVLCKQAVCLAAGSNPSAKPYLTLGEDSSTALAYPEFALRLSSAIRKALGFGLVKDRVQAVAILVILSLYTHFSQDRHLSAELAAQAVSNAQTVGLHLQNPPARSEEPAYLTRLFCCVWAMDQLNAAFHGRPIMMHERDLGRDMEACIAEQDSCFRLFLKIVVLLGRIIDLYRPAAKNTGCVVMEDLPSFESLVEMAQALGVESRLLASIELLYHGIAILSCRIPVGSTRSEHLSLAYTRQSLSAIKITAIVKQFGNSLSHMTFVPYAVSLSLRVAYRELRSSKVPMLTARSRRQFQSTCKVLKELGGMFRSALVMVDLAEQVIQEIDQVCSNALNEQNVNDSVGTPTATRQGDTTAAEGPETANAAGVENLPLHSESISGFDASLFEGPAGFDVFEFFDPGDLNAIDAILGGDAPPGFGHFGSLI